MVAARAGSGSSEEGLASSLEAMSPGRMQDYWPSLRSSPCPIACVAGAKDAKFAAIASRVAGEVASGSGTVHVASPGDVDHLPVALGGGLAVHVAGAGHAVHLERPLLVSLIVARLVSLINAQAGPPFAFR